MIKELLLKHSIVGVCANRSEGKTMTVLTELLHLKREHPQTKIYAYGVNVEIHSVLEKNGIHILRNKLDILDLQLSNCIVFVDEVALFFDSQGRSKQGAKFMRFCDRIEHKNCKAILATAREGYFNKFMCGRITAFIVKQIEYDALVNGTWLKDSVKGIESISDYRLVCLKGEYYTVTNKDGLTNKHSVPYYEALDTKKDNACIFSGVVKNVDKKLDENCEIKRERKSKLKVETKNEFETLQQKGFLKVEK